MASDYFSALLTGSWSLNHNRLTFQPGKLENAFKWVSKRIVLKNAPLDNPEFIRFVHDFELNHPNGPALAFCQRFSYEEYTD